MKLEFTKMQGLGNDYIYVDCTTKPLKKPSEVAKKVSDRHFGIGGDGLVLISSSRSADFKMRMFNADGSEGKMCGNAIRCVGKYVYEKGLSDKEKLKIETKSGVKILDLNFKRKKVDTVTVKMGKAVLEPEKVPINYVGENVINQPFVLNGVEYHITALSIGNPHCVIFCADVENMDVESVGRGFETNEAFPEQVNTEFVKVINDHTLEMRVWERGSGETMACGTGACAAVVASVLNGYCKYGEEVTVKLKGGDLTIVYYEDGNVRMEGPAEFVFDGEIEI